MNERGPDFLQWVCTPSLGKITSHRDSQFTVDKGEDKIFPSEGVTAPLKIHGAPLIHHSNSPKVCTLLNRKALTLVFLLKYLNL